MKSKTKRTQVPEAELCISEFPVTESPNAGPLVGNAEHPSFADSETDALTRDMPVAKEVEHWQLDRLIPYARNPRTHSAAQVAQIAASIVEFGFTNPILVDSKAGIIAGHGRLLAARKLQLPLVPVIVLNRLTENAGWDEELLQLELAALNEADFDLGLTGVEDDEIARLLAQQEAGEGLVDEDAIPELVPTPVTALGDVWLLGEHRLLCGDSTVPESVERMMAGELADLIFTDPPYNVDYEGYTKQRLKICGDRMGGEQFQQFLAATFASCHRIVTVSYTHLRAHETGRNL